MTPQQVIAIFDIGKTNKKILLFTREYHVIYEEEITIPTILDEDGFPCDDIMALVNWVRGTFDRLAVEPAWDIQAVNFSTFGASLVHLDKTGKAVAPLYSYLKPLDAALTESFYGMFGSPAEFSFQTGSPALNMLNSGIQLYWLKHRKPEIFQRVYCSLHIPQFVSFLFTYECQADISSIGCHTGLWDVTRGRYHTWLGNEDVIERLPAAQDLHNSKKIKYKNKDLLVGIGVHDSSASVLPFIKNTDDSIAILSTGTWNILLHPGYAEQLSLGHYQKDCLYYYLAIDQPVAAARIFLGNEMECQVKRLNDHFKKPADYYTHIETNANMLEELAGANSRRNTFYPLTMKDSGPFPTLQGPAPELSQFSGFEKAYHKLVLDMTFLQKESIQLLLGPSPVKKLFVTGGFTRNILFMDILQHLLPATTLYTAAVTNGSALGAALALHEQWNEGEMRKDLVGQKIYTPSVELNITGYSFLY